MRETIKKWAEERYTNEKRLEDVFPTYDIVVDGMEYKNATIFGNDECFDVDEFYQYMLVGNSLYMAYYDYDDECELWEIDYEKPYKVVQITDLDFLTD